MTYMKMQVAFQDGERMNIELADIKNVTFVGELPVVYHQPTKTIVSEAVTSVLYAPQTAADAPTAVDVPSIPAEEVGHTESQPEVPKPSVEPAEVKTVDTVQAITIPPADEVRQTPNPREDQRFKQVI